MITYDDDEGDDDEPPDATTLTTLGTQHKDRVKKQLMSLVVCYE